MKKVNENIVNEIVNEIAKQGYSTAHVYANGVDYSFNGNDFEKCEIETAPLNDGLADEFDYAGLVIVDEGLLSDIYDMHGELPDYLTLIAIKYGNYFEAAHNWAWVLAK